MPSNNNLKKSSSRLISVQILYEMEINGKSFELISKRFSKKYFSEIMSSKNDVMPDKSYIKHIVKGVSLHQKKIDIIINENLEKWSLPRIDSLARAILRSAVYELLSPNDVPDKVVFNEYIEISKLFFSSDEPSFINGILDTIANKDYRL
ncbi:MAG: transcription antitermination factor NusB [Pseudomonadota bacterium]|nr:transcription antitermination factor NusB [Pseudomonadota bacterium]MEE3295750.1 transcription antitermination factor NusB [Pseudomonadota bacterium]